MADDITREPIATDPNTTAKPALLAAPYGIVIDMQPWRYWGDCQMCERERRLDHAVGWYCGPVRQDPGEHVPEWGPDAIAGGMRVCKECHDRFYGVQAA